jgi:hypothetical protein
MGHEKYTLTPVHQVMEITGRFQLPYELPYDSINTTPKSILRQIEQNAEQ